MSIKSMLKSRARLIALSAVGLAVVGVLFTVLSPDQPSGCPIRITDTMKQGHQQCVTLERVDTPEKLQTGLSGRNDMTNNLGMLFVFDKTDDVCMWMKDMKFSIDIVWLNDQKEIIKIKEDVKPETYPESFCQADTSYVIELKAGVARQSNLKISQRLNF